MSDYKWHPCKYNHCKLEHDVSWVGDKWYVWRDAAGNEEIARMKEDAYDHFYPPTKLMKEENVVAFRESVLGVDDNWLVEAKYHES